MAGLWLLLMTITNISYISKLKKLMAGFLVLKFNVIEINKIEIALSYNSKILTKQKVTQNNFQTRSVEGVYLYLQLRNILLLGRLEYLMKLLLLLMN